MNEPLFFGVPISLAFLYFIIYSVLGWCMETIYCSVAERRLVPRGFLYGPLCPIYGVGVLMMICWFQPLMGNPVLFYVVATVCMSTWEYMVGWFLETTTHMKYWDYSQYRFNLHGRICLWVCLVWGILSFLVLYFIHPKVAEQVAKLPLIPRYVLDGFFSGGAGGRYHCYGLSACPGISDAGAVETNRNGASGTGKAELQRDGRKAGSLCRAAGGSFAG